MDVFAPAVEAAPLPAFAATNAAPFIDGAQNAVQVPAPSAQPAVPATPIGTHREVALRALRAVADDARNDVGARIQAAQSLLYADVEAPVASAAGSVGADVRTGWDDLLSLGTRIWRPSLFLAIGAATAFGLAHFGVL